MEVVSLLGSWAAEFILNKQISLSTDSWSAAYQNEGPLSMPVNQATTDEDGPFGHIGRKGDT